MTVGYAYWAVLLQGVLVGTGHLLNLYNKSVRLVRLRVVDMTCVTQRTWLNEDLDLSLSQNVTTDVPHALTWHSCSANDSSRSIYRKE